MDDDKHTNDNELTCPITLELFHDPVLATDGHVYERQAITRWIRQHGTSPFTRQILRVEDLYSNDHLKQLADQRRNSTVSYNKNTQTIKLPLQSRWSRDRDNATIHPDESPTIPHTTIPRSDSEKRSWIAITLMIIAMGGVLWITLLVVVTIHALNQKMTPSSDYTSNSCLSSSQVTTLLRLTNAAAFNYTYYSYLYKAMSSNDTIVFSFRHDFSYWCLDDLSMLNVNSKSQLIRNGDFESVFFKPFNFCSQANHSLPNLSSGNSSQHSGFYAFCLKSPSYADYLSQNLKTSKGQIYNVSFWIQNRGQSANELIVNIIA